MNELIFFCMNAKIEREFLGKFNEIEIPIRKIE